MFARHICVHTERGQTWRQRSNPNGYLQDPSTMLLQKLTHPLPVKTFPASCRNRRFFTVSTKPTTGPYSKPNDSSSHSLILRVLHFHLYLGLPSDPFPLRSVTKSVDISDSPTCAPHVPLLLVDHVTKPRPVTDPEDSLPCLQSLLLSQKIHYCVYNACYWPRIFFAVFTKPPIEPEDPLLCSQCLLLTQNILYRVYKASFGDWRPITMFTDTLMDPEDSLPCLQNTPVFPSALGISIDPFQVTGLERSFQNAVFICWTNWLYRLWSSGIGSSHSHWMLKLHIFSFAALLCWRHCLQRGSSNRNR